MKYFFLITLFLFSSCSLLNPNPNRDDERPLELKPFNTDYCSEWPEGIQNDPKQWADCCFTHDLHYWVGGTKEEKQKSDQELKECVKMAGSPLNSFLMYIGVRIGGNPGDASYSWGYGWTKSRGYAPLTVDDLISARYLLENSARSKDPQKEIIIQNFIHKSLVK